MIEKRGTDHDLIVVLGEKMENLTREVREANDGTKERLASLEGRMSKVEDEHLAIGGVSNAYKLVQENSKWIENEKRTRFLYRLIYGTIGGIIGFVINLIALKTGLLGIK